MKRNQKYTKFILLTIIALMLAVLVRIVNKYYVITLRTAIFPAQTLSPAAELEEKWITYYNKELGLLIKHPANLKVIREEERSVGQPIRYVGYSILIADAAKRLETTESIVIEIENSLLYEVPRSGGEIIALNKDNLELFHLAGPEEVQKTDISGRYALLTQHATSGLHTFISILDDERVIKIKIGSEDRSVIARHNKILSTIKITN